MHVTIAARSRRALAGTGRISQFWTMLPGRPILETSCLPVLTERLLRICKISLSAGAARGIRTPDPIITKREIGASEGCTSVRGCTGKYAVVHRRISVPAALADALR